jgi:hypothetical protein
MMRSSIVTVASLVLSSLSLIHAQDPGVREYEDRRQPAASSSGGVSGPIVKSAAVINNMEVLDDSQPIESGDLISS